MAKRMLIIDDRENLKKTLRNIFEEMGCNVVVASNGEEGLAILDKEKVDFVLTDLVMVDVKMPGMDGYEVCRQIKKVRKLPVKVVIYTATYEHIDAVKARRNGADDFIIKGEDPVLLIKSVKKLLG